MAAFCEVGEVRPHGYAHRHPDFIGGDDAMIRITFQFELTTHENIANRDASGEMLSMVALCRRAHSRSVAKVRNACNWPFASSSWAMRCNITGEVSGTCFIRYRLYPIVTFKI